MHRTTVNSHTLHSLSLPPAGRFASPLLGHVPNDGLAARTLWGLGRGVDLAIDGQDPAVPPHERARIAAVDVGVKPGAQKHALIFPGLAAIVADHLQDAPMPSPLVANL